MRALPVIWALGLCAAIAIDRAAAYLAGSAAFALLALGLPPALRRARLALEDWAPPDDFGR